MAGVEATVVETAVVSFAFVVVAAGVTLTVAGSVLSSYIVPLVAADEEENRFRFGYRQHKLLPRLSRL